LKAGSVSVFRQRST